MTDQSSIWQLSKGAQGAIPKTYVNKNRPPQAVNHTPRSTRSQAANPLHYSDNEAYTPRLLNTGTPDSQLTWDREGEFAMGPRTGNNTYTEIPTPGPNTSMHPEIQNIAANLTVLEQQQDRLDKSITNLGDKKIRAGRGRGLRRIREERRPGRGDENRRDEEEVEPRATDRVVEEEVEEIVIENADNRHNERYDRNPVIQGVNEQAHNLRQDHVADSNLVNGENHIGSYVHEDRRDRVPEQNQDQGDGDGEDHGNDAMADRDQKGWWQTSGWTFLQWGLALFSSLYLIGPYRLLSIIHSLPSFEWILTWGSRVCIALVVAKVMLSLTVYVFGKSALLSLTYFMCPNIFHAGLYKIIGRKPSAGSKSRSGRQAPASNVSQSIRRPPASNVSQSTKQPPVSNISQSNRKASTSNKSQSAYRRTELQGRQSLGRSNSAAHRTFTYDPEPDNVVNLDRREDNSGQEDSSGQDDSSGQEEGDNCGQGGRDRRSRDAYRIPGAGLTDLLRQNVGTGSGGWNGDDMTTSTPAAPPQYSRRRKVGNGSNSSHSRNFRPSRGYREMGSGSQVNINEELNQEHSYNPSFLEELSMHDQEVIGEHVSVSSYAQNVSVKEFDGTYDKYESFRREFMAMVPGIHPRVRLSTLRTAIKCKDALRVIEDFVDTDQETFCAALLALDWEYNDIDETAERLLDQIRKIMQSPHTDSEDFVSKFNDLTSYAKRLYKLKPDCKIALDALAKDWVKYVPVPVYKTVTKRLARNKKWINFANLYDLCEEFSLSVKHSRSISKERDQVFNSGKKHKHNVYTVNGDSSIPPTSEEGEGYDVNFVRKGFTKPPSSNCCFCNSKEHHSTACPVNMSPEERRNIVYGANIRCLLCLEEGHRVGWCLLVRLKSNIPFKCECKSDKPTHAKIICEVVKPRTTGF